MTDGRLQVNLGKLLLSDDAKVATAEVCCCHCPPTPEVQLASVVTDCPPPEGWPEVMIPCKPDGEYQFIEIQETAPGPTCWWIWHYPAGLGWVFVLAVGHFPDGHWEVGIVYAGLWFTYHDLDVEGITLDEETGELSGSFEIPGVSEGGDDCTAYTATVTLG